MRRLGFFVVVAFCSVGCGCNRNVSKTTAPAVPPSGPVSQAPSQNPPPAPPAGSTDSQTPAAESNPSQPPAPSTADIAANLKTDAYAYYGLENSKPIKQVELGNGPPKTVTTILKMTGLQNGIPTFEETQTGEPTEEAQTMTLAVDGIYLESLSPAVLSTPHQLLLPAKLTVGTEWKNHLAFTQGDVKMEVENSYKVAGIGTVKTKGGTFDKALHVTGTGAGIKDGKALIFKYDDWYVKGFGEVKQVLNGGAGSKPISIELSD